MNGVHDMGGTHGLGPVATEAGEPVFHHAWEGRALALTLATGAWRRWTLDGMRHQRELINGPDYLTMSYYEKWISALEAMLLKTQLISPIELAEGRPEPGSQKVSAPLKAPMVEQALAVGNPSLRPAAALPKYSVGDAVRAINVHPEGHTRLARYVRGRQGLVARHHGAHVYPDANAHGLGERPEPLYQVRFEASELWGPQSRPKGAVYLDLWESYLDPA